MIETFTEYLRGHIWSNLFVLRKREDLLPDLPELYLSESCPEFEKRRKARMIIGAFRYGLLCSKEKAGDFDLWGGLLKKLNEYRVSGNTEALIDASNYLMLVYMNPEHPDAHFKANDEHNHCPRR